MRKLPFTPRSFSEVGPLIFTSLFLALIIFLNIFVPTLAQTDSCANSVLKETDQSKFLIDAKSCLDNLIRAKDQSIAATAGVKKQIDGIKARVTFIETDIATKQKQIDNSEIELAKIMDVLYATIRNYYMESQGNCPICDLLINPSISDFVKIQAYEKTRIDRDKSFIINTVHSIQTLQESKKTLEQERISLAGVKTSLDKVVADSLVYQSTLSDQISKLSQRQQEIINSRSGSFTVSIGDSELADDYNASAKGFSESAPSGYFGVFSFGAYTHRNGMSQYGALGRSASKETEDILSFYYPGKELKKDYSEPSTIHVKGDGKSCSGAAKYYDEDVDFQTYMKSVWEVPASWPDKVLRAQAVAARSYAINRMNGVGYIVPNEGAGGQVYKDCQKEGGWPSAVESTRGWVLTNGGTAAFTEFSSTTGGWINGVGWDTTDGSGGSNFVDKAYEKIGASPWLYKAWYTESYSVNSDKCGRSNAWLSPQEMADIVNAAIAFKTGGIDTSRITPISSCWGGSPYSMDELKNLVGSNGISSANSVVVSQGNGLTNTVTINGIELSGAEFKKAFNVRAPGRLSIPQSGFAFFDIKRK